MSNQKLPHEQGRRFRERREQTENKVLGSPAFRGRREPEAECLTGKS